VRTQKPVVKVSKNNVVQSQYFETCTRGSYYFFFDAAAVLSCSKKRRLMEMRTTFVENSGR
jgi:hypothetical protein